MLGFGLLPFLRKGDRAVLRAGALWLASPIVFYALLLALSAFAQDTPQAEGGGLPAPLAEAVRGFANGGYFDVVKGNAIFTGANAARRLLLMFFPRVFGMFLLGFYAGRAGVFGAAEASPYERRICAFGFTIGLPLAFAGGWLGDSAGPRPPSWLGMLEVSAETIATPALALAYGAAICLAFRRFRGLLMPLAPVGRMALTS